MRKSAIAGRILRERRPDAVIHTIHRRRTYVGRLRSPRYMSLSRGAQSHHHVTHAKPIVPLQIYAKPIYAKILCQIRRSAL